MQLEVSVGSRRMETFWSPGHGLEGQAWAQSSSRQHKRLVGAGEGGSGRPGQKEAGHGRCEGVEC